ncbi:MAG: hypothetical protein ACC628_19590 [Pirellulaceae bacterium]
MRSSVPSLSRSTRPYYSLARNRDIPYYPRNWKRHPATRTERPSWDYMISKGAGTIWERWDIGTQVDVTWSTG